MVVRILSSLLMPGAVPFMTEIAYLKAPATSPRCARVEITPLIVKEPFGKASTSKP
jgi:hypothetical protein